MNTKSFWRKLWLGIIVWGLAPAFVFAQDLSPQGVADLARPATLQIGTHVFGKVKVPDITVDARARTIEVVPESDKEVVIDEYLTGSGFVFQEGGYVATNAHVVSLNTLKQRIVSEKALSALYENALSLTDDEMQALLKEGRGGFLEEVFRTLLEKSSFELQREVRVLDPKRGAQTLIEATGSGQLVEVLAETPNFLSGGADIALLKTGLAPAPALRFNKKEVAVGEKVYIVSYPSTASIGERTTGEATFTAGIVSAIKTTNDGRVIYQTDAKISQGSSGGPVLNTEGEVIGIVTFQTQALERENGDNFAFAQSTEDLAEMASDLRIEPSEGLFAQGFRKGFQAYIERRCEEMEASFGSLKTIHPFYASEKSLEGYRSECTLWQAEGSTHDNQFLSWEETFLREKGSFWWLFTGSLVFVGAVIILILWLLRQLERDEKEIARLTQRLEQDEDALFRQQKQSQQWFLEHDQSNSHSSDIHRQL